MTTFYLIRHAEKDLDAGVISGRSSGVHLSETGRRQAERLAQHLADTPIRRICSSPLERAQETAGPLAHEKGLHVEVSEAIGEIDYGAWTNQAVDDLDAADDWQRYHAFRSGQRIPDGEWLLEVQVRFVGEMLRLRAQVAAGVVLVSHGDPIRLAAAHFLGIPLDLFSRLEIRPASVTTIAIGDYGPKVRGLNAVPARWDAG